MARERIEIMFDMGMRYGNGDGIRRLNQQVYDDRIARIGSSVR
jgi:hypothetical protein